MKWRIVPSHAEDSFWKIIASVQQQTALEELGKQLGNVEHCITLTFTASGRLKHAKLLHSTNADSGGCIFVFSGERHERLKFLIGFSTSRDNYCCVLYKPCQWALPGCQQENREVRRVEWVITGTEEWFRKTSRGPRGPQLHQFPKQQPFNSIYRPEGGKKMGTDGSETNYSFPLWALKKVAKS